MSRLRRIGLVVAAALLVVAVTVPPSGVGMTDASLKALRGGDVVYCSYPLYMGPGCTSCNFIANCWATVNGMPTMVSTYSKCSNTNVSTLCFSYSTPADPTPTCNRGLRSWPCGTGTVYSFVMDCSTSSNSNAGMCGNMNAYLCGGTYDLSTTGPMATGVNCQNANGGLQ